MSAAQSRYSTLVRYATGIYSAGDSQGRTAVMTEALNQVVSVSSDWDAIHRDSLRLLKVWMAKESDPAAGIVIDQILDLLREIALEKTDPPTLKITEPPSVITHIPEPALLSPMIKIVKIEESDAETEEEEVVEEEAVEEEAVEEEEEVVEEEEEAVEEEATKEAIEEEATKEAIEEEATEEAVEEEATEEEEEVEEEGLEVEKRMIRGVPYWLEVNTHKLYGVIDDDDVGDEVGELVGGKPQFYAK